MRKLLVTRQETAIYVRGTDQIVEAAAALPETVTRWEGSFPGQFVRRGGVIYRVSEFRPPKDARPGVVFVGIQEAGGDR